MKTTAFKMTELGPIPSDWEVKRLGEVFSLLRNNTYARESLTEEGGSVFNIHYGDVLIKFGAIVDFDRDSIPYLKPSVPANKDTLQDGDLIFADTAEDETVGKACEVANLKGRKAVSGLHTILCRPNESLFASGYLGYYINSAAYHNQLLPLITGTKVSSISRGGLESTLIVLPPLPEQHRIAAALSDMDELIGALGKLVEKKRAIKTGAMQRLLTGQTRLPGFGGTGFKQTELGPIPADWEVKRIDRCGDVITGSTPPREKPELWNGSFNWVSANDFKGKYIISSEEKVSEKGKRYCRLLPKDSVLVTCIASIGLNAIAKQPCATNQQINAVVCKFCNFEFLYYQCCFNVERLRHVAGQTAVPIIGKRQFEEFQIVLPTNLAEQHAIAAVLSDMDEEIAALEAEKRKVEAIKQGMMQELLTGKTRLLKGE